MNNTRGLKKVAGKTSAAAPGCLFPQYPGAILITAALRRWFYFLRCERTVFDAGLCKIGHGMQFLYSVKVGFVRFYAKRLS